MIFIAHRGNTRGPHDTMENHPLHIANAMGMGYHVEVDVWWHNNQFMLGHDSPDHFVPETFLQDQKIWCHAKNIVSLEKMLSNKKINCFFHNTDDCVLTSKGYIWTYPGKLLTNKSIAVLPEKISEPYDWQNAYGICSDYVVDYEDKLK